ncbi:MAG: SCO family protein [Pseudomonadota bacterium]
MASVISPSFRAILSTAIIVLAALFILAPRSAISAEYASAHYRDFPLVDQNGEAFSLSDFEHETVIVNFVFTGCRTYCPVQAGALSTFYDDLKQRAPDTPFKIVSITLTPVFDGPREMRSYSEPFSKGRDNWMFATGKPGHIQDMLEQLELEVFYGERPGIDVLHETDIFLLHPSSNRTERFEGVPLDHQGIRAAILATS